MPCPSNNLLNETEIVLRVLYISLATIRHVTMCNMWQLEEKKTVTIRTFSHVVQKKIKLKGGGCLKKKKKKKKKKIKK